MVEIINKDIFKGIAGKRSGKPKGVVIHNDAGSKNATAKWYMTTFLPDRVKVKQSNLGFAHYYVDRNTIGRCENTNNKAWHVGQSDGNANYIGFEVCQSIGESEANFKLNEEMTFRQVAEDLQFYGLPANRDTVKLHKQFSSTSCPHRSVALHGDNTKVQDYFIARVKHYMSLGKTVAEMLKKDNQAVVSKPVSTPVAPKPATKSIDTLVAETKAGKHGNGDARKKSLGSNYDAVMKVINGGSKPAAKPVTNKKRVYLPKSAKTWRVYKTSGPYTTGREVGFLAPAQYGGLDYEIIKTLATDVYQIKTGAFGNVAIYAAKSTGATVK